MPAVQRDEIVSQFFEQREAKAGKQQKGEQDDDNLPERARVRLPRLDENHQQQNADRMEESQVGQETKHTIVIQHRGPQVHQQQDDIQRTQEQSNTEGGRVLPAAYLRPQQHRRQTANDRQKFQPQALEKGQQPAIPSNRGIPEWLPKVRITIGIEEGRQAAGQGSCEQGQDVRPIPRRARQQHQR